MINRISIALATYNGARFLPEFLDSILCQRQLPAELIVCDDASEDETVAILESFSQKASPIAVKIYRNPTRLGVTQNFSRAISLCTSDFIALADQDDVWQADKLSQVSQALTDTGSAAVFSDADVVTENLIPLGYSMWQCICFNKHEQKLMVNGRPLEVLLKHKVVTGATLGFQKSLCNAILPIPPEWQHDAWIALVAAAVGGLYPINKPLISYRQHGGNVTGGLRKSFREEMRAAKNLNRHQWYREEIEQLHLLQERLQTKLGRDTVPERLLEKIAHLEIRASLPEPRFKRLSKVIHEVVSGRYVAYSRNWGSIAVDLLVK